MEGTSVSDIHKRSKNSKKKNKMDDIEENCLRLNEKVKETKRKKKHVVTGDVEIDSAAFSEDGNGKGCEPWDGDGQKEYDLKRKKKKKRKLETGEIASDFKDAVLTDVQNVVELSENENWKQTKKDKRVVYGVVENDKDKIHTKKKRKVYHVEVEDPMNNESQMEGQNGKKSIGTEKKAEEGSKEKRSRKEKNMKAQDDKDSGNMREENVNNDDGSVEKKRKKKKKVDHDEETLNDEEVLIKGDNGHKSSHKQDNTSLDNNGEEGSKEKKKKKKKIQVEDNAADNSGVGEKKRKKETGKKDIDSENPKPKARKAKKKVSFSGNVEIFPTKEEKLLRGKRFSKEEDEKVKEAVNKYIAAHNLGEEGLNKVLNCRAHPEVKDCWKEICTAIPYRPFKSIYYRAHILFERDETRRWTEEEKEFIMKAQEKYGNNWKLIADEMGKHRFHVKDTWRRIKLPNKKKGHWSQDEYQALFDLVNVDLQIKASEEKVKKSKHGMLRDNICWGAISDTLSTRTNQSCCIKWYAQLSSPMVQQGIWADVDDYRLLDVLFNLDACCIEDVDWDMLIEHRSGDICRKRWDQMVLHIGQHGLKSFSEQVDILAKRYCPDLAELREEWDSKPVVD